MAVAVMIPRVGNTVEACLLGAWKKHAGDPVAKGEILLEIETDKTVFEVESPAAGILLAVFFREGELVPVLTNIAVIGEKGEAYARFLPPAAPQVPPGAAAGSAALSLPGAGPEQAGAAPVLAPVVQQPAGGEMPGRMSPRARAFMQQHHLQAAGFKGSGPAGRILEQDVMRAFYTQPRLSLLAGKLLGLGWSHRGTCSGFNGMINGADLRQPGTKLSAVRTAIAGRMRTSLASTAQYTIALSACAAELLALRRELKTQADPGLRDITVGDMVMYSLVRTLQAFPDFNAELLDGYVYRYREINLGFACDTPRGLLVPVVKHADRLQLPELAAAVKRLAAGAGEGRLTPDELTCGTFTVTNLGSLGIEYFTPVLNAPQTAILGIGSIGLKPVRVKEATEFVEHITLCLTVDHQVIDGAPAARFLAALKTQIENFRDISGITRQA